jgi:demethoxyubiquinone hydroxylase (CLK1/Coq7/Cat5 family)
MLGETTTLHYLTALDIKASRYLKSLGLSQSSIREAAYLLGNHAIELRAEELYPIYDVVLGQHSRVAVKSILLEEKEHLNEMKEWLEKILSGFIHAEQICSIEIAFCMHIARVL